MLGIVRLEEYFVLFIYSNNITFIFVNFSYLIPQILCLSGRNQSVFDTYNSFISDLIQDELLLRKCIWISSKTFLTLTSNADVVIQ